MSEAIQAEEEIPPRHQFFRPAQVHARLLHAADEQLFDTHFARNFLKRLLRIADRKRHQNGARPGRDLVDIEPEPVGKQNDLWWNGWNRIVIVLAKKAEINLGKCIDFGDPAEFENVFAGTLQDGMISIISRQL